VPHWKAGRCCERRLFVRGFDVYDDRPQLSADLLVKDRVPQPSARGTAAHHSGSTLRLAARPSAALASLSASQDFGRSQQEPSPTTIKIEALADLMEEWAAALPRWDAQVAEPWFAYLERAYEAETALAERLRRLPTCRLSMCPVRQDISLSLAGISVISDQGLPGACRAWSQMARQRGVC
jgi:hypothetical protein